MMILMILYEDIPVSGIMNEFSLVMMVDRF